jgi:acetyl-CoA synthetase
MVLSRIPMTTYGELTSSFRWRLPPRYNMGVDVVDRHPRNSCAIISSDGRNELRRTTYGELSESSNRLANALGELGVHPGDRVGVVLSQRLETVVAHAAIYKLGAIAVPLSVLFGPEALESRLRDADVIAAIGEPEAVEKIRTLSLVPHLVDVNRDWDDLLARASPYFQAAPTTPDTPALIIYTSGTTGPPKGALHGHRLLYGHLPGVELSHDFFPQGGDLFWTPADWAWIGGLFDVVMPCLYHGYPVVAFRAAHFDPEQALDLISNLGIRNLFLPPTALRRMSQVTARPLTVRSVASGGESLSEDLVEWGQSHLGVLINQFYGQTEANVVISNCSSLWQPQRGSIGKPCPGHEVQLIDGEICVKAAGDPVVFLGYWNNPESTAEKVRDGWLRTGDLAEIDEDGSYRFVARSDDVINSGGYRIGPGEVEGSLVKHPAVSMAAVVGAPDPLRGEAVKAFVVTVPGVTPSEALAAELQKFVALRLAAYEYPRQIVFVSELPMTSTGKIQRSVLRTW